jgi:DNA polymerase-1
MLLIIDGNALGHAYHRATRLTVGDFEVQAIFGMVREMRSLRITAPGAQIVVLWDGYAHHRFELLPDYKGDRERAEKTDPEIAQVRAAYRKQVPVIKKAIELLGVQQIDHPNFEADDIAGAICSQTKGVRKRLVTGDTDWLQLVDETTEWHDPRMEGKLITRATFFERTGYHSPDEYLQGKALIGDSTDSIPGIDGIANKTASMFLAKWFTVEKFFEAVDAGTYTPATRKSKDAKTPHPEQTLASPEGRAIFRRNMQLMDLRTPRPGISQGLCVRQRPLDRDGFQTLCARLNFASVTKAFDSWMLPFAQRDLPLAA